MPKHQGVGLADHRERQREANTQSAQLDDLLGESIEVPTTDAEYASARGRMATLRAFLRKLSSIQADPRVRGITHSLPTNKKRIEVNRTHIARLDVAHPEYKGTYRARYDQALKECGMVPGSQTTRWLGNLVWSRNPGGHGVHVVSSLTTGIPFIHYLTSE